MTFHPYPGLTVACALLLRGWHWRLWQQKAAMDCAPVDAIWPRRRFAGHAVAHARRRAQYAASRT